MPKNITEEKRILSFAKIFMAQYLSKMHGFDSFQEGAIDMLSLYLVNTIKIFAVKVKKVLDLQGRTLANPLHLLVVNEMYDLVDNEAILKHIIEMKEVKQQDFDVLRKYAGVFFKQEIAEINNYKACTKYKNITYVPSVYTTPIMENPLPYRLPLHKSIPLPKDLTYKGTEKLIKIRAQKSQQLEQLEAYHRRQLKKANSTLLKQKEPQKEQNKTKEASILNMTSPQKDLGQEKGKQNDNLGSVPKVQKKQDSKLIIGKSSSCTHLPDTKQMRKSKSSIDLIKKAITLEDPDSEDHKIADKYDNKESQSVKESSKIEEKEKTEDKPVEKHPKPEELTLQKAIQKLQLSTSLPKATSPTKFRSSLGLSQNQKRQQDEILVESGKKPVLGRKKNKFQLVSFL